MTWIPPRSRREMAHRSSEREKQKCAHCGQPFWFHLLDARQRLNLIGLEHSTRAVNCAAFSPTVTPVLRGKKAGSDTRENGGRGHARR